MRDLITVVVVVGSFVVVTALVYYHAVRVLWGLERMRAFGIFVLTVITFGAAVWLWWPILPIILRLNGR